MPISSKPTLRSPHQCCPLTCYSLVGISSSILITASTTQDESQLVPERCGTPLTKSLIHPLMSLTLRSLTGSHPPSLHLPHLLPPSLIYLPPSMIQKMNMWRRNDVQVPPEVDCAPLISILVFRILVFALPFVSCPIRINLWHC